MDMGDMTGPKLGEYPGTLLGPETIGPLPTGIPYIGVNPLLDPIKFFKASMPEPIPLEFFVDILARVAVFKPVSPRPVPSRLFSPET
jgi:hypothetical protein